MKPSPCHLQGDRNRPSAGRMAEEGHRYASKNIKSKFYEERRRFIVIIDGRIDIVICRGCFASNKVQSLVLCVISSNALVTSIMLNARKNKRVYQGRYCV